MAAEEKRYLGETIEVKQQHRFDEKRLHEYLGDSIEGYEGPLTVKQFEGGQSNPTYMLVTPKRKYVMRRKPPGKLLKSAHAVDREFRVMSALNKVDFPVPTAHVLCEDESVAGTIFFVMSYVPGRVFWDPTMPDLNNAERAAVFDSVNETIAKLHQVDYRAIGLEDFGRPGNYFARQISRWSKQYQLSETETVEEMDQLIEWLPTSIPGDDETCLIHGDYSFHNILIHPTEPKVAAVLDWELSTTGHPLGDLTYNTMAWYRPKLSDGRGSFEGVDLKALGIPSFDEYVTRYCERTGRKPIENVAWYRAYNLFRSAAIAQGILGRVRDGTAAAANATELGATIRPMAQAAWKEAKAAGAP
jgi:aminoglycoside phosphotransferase (APT) family kinase protein